MKRIFKWTLAMVGEEQIDLPTGAEILCVQMQGEHPQIWALCDPGQPKTSRTIVTYGTGHSIPDNPGHYIGTFQLFEGKFIGHVFEREQP